MSVSTVSLRLTPAEREAVSRFSSGIVDQINASGTAQAISVGERNLFSSLSDNKFLRQVLKLLPWFSVGGLVGFHLLTASPVLAIGSGLVMSVSLILRRAAKKDNFANRLLGKIKGPRAVRLVIGVLFGSTLWMRHTNPLFAQFFQVAEDFFLTTFPDAGDVVPLVFGVIRALFLVYIAVSLVRVVQSARNDDDWQQLARAPMIIVMAVVIGDVLASLVIGGA